MTDRCAISCIIVSYNCLDSLQNCISSLSGQTGIEHEIIVVDNASSDGTIEYLSGRDFKTIFSDLNLGYGRAVNLGARRASGKYLFILNPDTVVGPRTLSELYRFAELSENVGLISPMLLHFDGSPQVTARKLPGRMDFVFGRGSPLYKLGLTGESAAGYIAPIDDKPMETPTVSATALLVNRELFATIGGFDPRFFLYLEDIDLCRRISEAGLKVMLLPTVTIGHAWRGSSGKKPLFAIYHHHRSVWRYFRKYYPGEWHYNLPLLIALCVGFMISSLLAVLRKRGSD